MEKKMDECLILISKRGRAASGTVLLANRKVTRPTSGVRRGSLEDLLKVAVRHAPRPILWQ